MIKYPRLLISFLTCFVLVQSIVITAQEKTIITVSALEWVGDLYEDTIIPMFEAEHPDIQVEFVYSDTTYFGNPLYESETQEDGFYENITEYVTSADVLYVSDSTLTPYAVNTGFFLDLAPLVNADNDIAVDDFYPAAWSAFQSDGGMWALPYSMEVQLLVYDRNAFDAVNFPYPDETWGIEDYIRVAEAMHTYNSQGEVELSPIVAINPGYLMYDTVGSLVDNMTIPAQPDFSNPELARVLEAYTAYDQAYEFAEFQGYAYDELPMSISYPYQLANNAGGSGADKDWAISLLPGNFAGSRVEGFAISKGTAYPEAAYEFVSFMTRNMDIFQYSFGAVPARRSLANVELEEDSFVSRPEFDPEMQAIVDQALEVAISPVELRYSEAFYRARSLVNDQGMDVQTALETVEEEMIEALSKSQEMQSEQIYVAEPQLRPELAPGEIVLQFGMNLQGSINEREHIWDDVINEFVAQHPTIGQIDLDYQIYGPEGLDEDLDCWYNSYGGSFASATEPPEGFLALNPLLSADPSFDPNSFLPGVLEGVQIDSLMYGYPITVQPMVMWINVDKFAEANLPIPAGSWSVNDFTNALIALEALRTDPEVPIVRAEMYSPAWLIMLIASYGGQPIDYSTDPITFNLTDEQNFAAIQQVVAYIQDGLIGYSGLFEQENVFYSMMSEDDFIRIEVFGDLNLGMPITDMLAEDSPMRIVTFPDGVFMPVAYSSGMAHINSESLNIQPCYDWIRHLASRPELFTGMPSRPAEFQNPALIAQQGSEVVDFYESLTNNLTAPNILTLPDVYGSVPGTSHGAWLEPNFFYQALDNTILHDADLETELIQAEANVIAYRECTSGIEQIPQQELIDLFDRDQDAGIAYSRQFVDCAVLLQPEWRERFSFYYQE